LNLVGGSELTVKGDLHSQEEEQEGWNAKSEGVIEQLLAGGGDNAAADKVNRILHDEGANGGSHGEVSGKG
jgi:hypothetical protein